MEDIEAHFQEDHFKKFAEELQQHLAGPKALSIGKYHSVRFFGFHLLYLIVRRTAEYSIWKETR